MNSDQSLLVELDNSIVAAARKVLVTLKPGLTEAAYENALVIELRKRGFRVEHQKVYEVRYEKELVDVLVVNLIVDGLTVVYCRVIEDFSPTLVAQVCGALEITQLSEGLILNFRRADLDWKHIDRETVPAAACL
jgi:GxxExxY protein